MMLGRSGDAMFTPANGSDTPLGVVTVNVRRPVAAPETIVPVISRLAEVELVTVAVTPAPLKSTAVAPARFLPVIVAENALP